MSSNVRHRAVPAISLLAISLLAIAVSALPLIATPALAAGPVDRHGWAAGIGYGLGAADVSLKVNDLQTGWTRGAAPQLRIGKMIGSHFMLGVEDRQWLDEGGLGDYEVRANFQNINAVVTVYPGRTTNLTSGIFLQAGVGAAHARISALEPIPGGNEWGETFEVVDKRDEGGSGFMFGAGYEFRVSGHLAIGVTTSYNSLSFGGDVFDEVKFYPAGLNLNWYF